MITSKSVTDEIADRIGKDGDLLKEVGAISAYAVVLSALAAGTTTPLAVVPAFIIAAGASLKATKLLIDRLSPPTDGNARTAVTASASNYDQFRVVYFLTIQRCFVQAVLQKQKTLEKRDSASCSERGHGDRTDAWVKGLALQIAKVDQTEIRFHYSLDPVQGTTEYFEACGACLATLIASTHRGHVEPLVAEIVSDALDRFRHFLSGNDANAQWIRNYLAISSYERVNNLSLELASLRSVIDGWISRSEDPAGRNRIHWDTYREHLKSLPDMPESMFNEAFGVSKVFVAPMVMYHRSGLPGTPDRPELVQDLGRLLGALVSNRMDNNDLIILCGGPGSGKSTLCRMIARELATDPNVHPVFLRLRRLKEGADIASFIEDSLIKEGLINRLSDLRTVANLVILLDGFDELVLASRSRLRQFFSGLLDDVRTGPLRNARVLVSGRDTLFPNGEGLPRASHVLVLQTFDLARVQAWGEKWRAAHAHNLGATFNPEALLSVGRLDHPNQPRSEALHQLVIWPLTLHLVARLHTAGHLDVSHVPEAPIEKAFLYREIMRQTAVRQAEQAGGSGRLEATLMREFLRVIAWSMYTRSVDSMDFTEVVPLARRFFPGRDEGALAELAEVAVVNAPELQKGEQTGFEFVHKSFAEFLAAERLAKTLQEISHEVCDPSGAREWHRTLREAGNALAEALCDRLLTAEVQEMLEPMMGNYAQFQQGEGVASAASLPAHHAGMQRLAGRLQDLYREFLVNSSPLVSGALTPVQHREMEALANLLAGIVAIANACVQRLRRGQVDVSFNLDPFDGAFWRFALFLHSGGLSLDPVLSSRLFSQGTYVQTAVGDLSQPIRVAPLHSIPGYGAFIGPSIERAMFVVNDLAVRLFTLLVLQEELALRDPRRQRGPHSSLDSGAESGQRGGADRQAASAASDDRRSLGEVDMHLATHSNSAHFIGHAAAHIDDAFRQMVRDFADAGLIGTSFVDRVVSESVLDTWTQAHVPGRSGGRFRLPTEVQSRSDVQGYLNELSRSLCGGFSPSGMLPSIPTAEWSQPESRYPTSPSSRRRPRGRKIGPPMNI